MYVVSLEAREEKNGQESVVSSLGPAPATAPGLVLQKVPSEGNPKVRNHGEGPY